MADNAEATRFYYISECGVFIPFVSKCCYFCPFCQMITWCRQMDVSMRHLITTQISKQTRGLHQAGGENIRHVG